MKILLLAVLVAAALAEKYTVQVSTKNVDSANSDGRFYADAVDYNRKRSIDFGVIDNPERNDFERGRTDTFEFYSDVVFDKIGCLVIRAGNQW